MRPTRTTSRIRSNWPPPEAQPPWRELFAERDYIDISRETPSVSDVCNRLSGDDVEHLPNDRTLIEHQPAIAHLDADEIATQLVEIIQDEAGGL